MHGPEEYISVCMGYINFNCAHLPWHVQMSWHYVIGLAVDVYIFAGT